MSKALQTYWFLQAIADAEVKRLAPDCAISVSVQHHDEEIDWDKECKGVGRVRWHCGYILPTDDITARAFVRMFNAAMAPWQARYDLGLTCG